MAGIVGYGAYIPRKRITTDEIAHQWGKDPAVIQRGLLLKEKSVPGFDEDTITISVAAGRSATRRAISPYRSPTRSRRSFVVPVSDPMNLSFHIDLYRYNISFRAERQAAAAGRAAWRVERLWSPHGDRVDDCVEVKSGGRRHEVRASFDRSGVRS